MVWQTEWMPRDEGDGDTVRILLEAFGEPTTDDTWWADVLDTPTQLRLRPIEAEDWTDETRSIALHRIYDEAARLAHVGRFAYND